MTHSERPDGIGDFEEGFHSACGDGHGGGMSVKVASGVASGQNRNTNSRVVRSAQSCSGAAVTLYVWLSLSILG
jgi:hypothetical protein